MGQKVNPHGLRLGFNKNWSAHWFSQKQYAEFLQQDDLIRKVIRKKYQRASIDQVEIYRSRGEINVAIHTAKIGVIVRRSGVGIQELKAEIDRALFTNVLPKDRPAVRISVLEVRSPELSARIVSENIAGQIERRISVKRAIRQACERTMERRAKGIKVRVSGRLGGAEIARSESNSVGSIPLQTLRSNISYAQTEAKTTFGVIGIKVWIYLGELDEVSFEASEQPSRPNRAR